MAKDIIVDVLIDNESPVVEASLVAEQPVIGVQVANKAGGNSLHDETLVGVGSKADPLGVNTEVIATKEELETKADKATTLSGYGITDAYTKEEINTKFGSVYHVKGSVATYDDLPDDATVGDVYNILDSGANYVWTGTEWDKLSETVDLSDYATKGELESKQDKLTAGTNITISDDNVISSTAQESFFRGRWENWVEVPNDANSYLEDFNGNRTPTTNDYMVVVDASAYVPGLTESIVVSKPQNTHYIIINGKTIGSSNEVRTYTFDTITYTVENTTGGNYIKLYANKTVQYNNKIIPAGTAIINTHYYEIIEPDNLYYSKLDNLSGTWRFGYKGIWAEDNESGWKPEYQIEETLPIATEEQAGINRLYTAGTNITIVDNVINSTAQESFFRGRYANWDVVPTNGASYPNDINGNHIPSNTDYIIIEDSSTVPGGQVEMQMTMETDRYSNFPTEKLETVINGITYNGAGTFDDGNIQVYCAVDGGNYTAHWKTLKNNVEYKGRTYEAGSVFFKVVIKPETNTTQNAKLSLGNPYTGSWRFSYRGTWDLDNKNGWKAEYQIEETLPVATETQAGINRIYTAGDNVTIEDNVISATGGGTMPARYVESINDWTGNVFLGCREIGTYTSVEIDEKIAELNAKITALEEMIKQN